MPKIVRFDTPDNDPKKGKAVEGKAKGTNRKDGTTSQGIASKQTLLVDFPPLCFFVSDN